MFDKVLMGAAAVMLGAGMWVSVRQTAWTDVEISGADWLAITIDENNLEEMGRLIAEEPRLANEPVGLVTPLVQAIWEDRREAVRFLLEHGADPNREVARGDTPLYFASQRGDPVLVQLLIRHGARVDGNADQARVPVMTTAGENGVRLSM